MTEQGGVERFVQVLNIDNGDPEMERHPSGPWVRYSDHLEQVEELERERDSLEELAEGLHRTAAGAAGRLAQAADEAEARADALQALLSEAVEEFKRRAENFKRSELPGSTSCKFALIAAASYLQQRLDELGSREVDEAGGGSTSEPDSCPTCGSPVKTVTSDEGTSCYVPVRGGGDG